MLKYKYIFRLYLNIVNNKLHNIANSKKAKYLNRIHILIIVNNFISAKLFYLFVIQDLNC